jgi:hypothetical protein
MYEAYQSLRNAFEILRMTIADQGYINYQNDNFNHWLNACMQGKLMNFLNDLVIQLAGNGNLQMPQVCSASIVEKIYEITSMEID